MKYADSFEYTATITAAGTYTSPWYDIDFANELYSYVISYTLAQTRDSEVCDVTLERYSPIAVGKILILTHTQDTVTNATGEEKYAKYQPDTTAAATNQLGTRVRFQIVAGGTFQVTPAQTMTVILRLIAKRN